MISGNKSFQLFQIFRDSKQIKQGNSLGDHCTRQTINLTELSLMMSYNSQIGCALALGNISFCLCSGLILVVQQKCTALQSSIHPGPINNSFFQ